MCGIIGAIGATATPAQRKKALALLRHRGPFGEGDIDLGDIWMGMTRLPMSSAQAFDLPMRHAPYVASFNGEVYRDGGGLDLRGELAALTDALDTGVFPDGMYALAAWDTGRRVLYLARDPAGIKPLYVHVDEARGRLHYASELPALLELLGRVRLDTDVLAEQIVAGVSLNQGTPFAGVRLLEPGTVLRAEGFASGRLRVTSTRLRTVEDACGATLDERLGASVGRCLHTFRELALLASGGLDSSLLSSYIPDAMRRFHVAVAGDYDRPGAMQQVTVTPLGEDEFAPALREAVRRFAMPTRMSSIVMYQRLADAVSAAGVHGVLMGEGADEMFWGYPRHLDFLAAGFPGDPHMLASAYFGDVPGKAARLLPPVAARRLADRVDTLCVLALGDGFETAVRRFDSDYSLEPLLRRADHLLMGSTIEARLPFLHNGLPAFGRALGRGNLEGDRQKAALQALGRQRLPGYPQDRRKRHFRVPFDRWPRVVAQMRDQIAAGREVLSALGLTPPGDDALATMDTSLLFTLTTAVLWWELHGDRIE